MQRPPYKPFEWTPGTMAAFRSVPGGAAQGQRLAFLEDLETWITTLTK